MNAVTEVLVPGSGGDPLVAGEPLLGCAGFWWCHLVGLGWPGPGEGWPEPEWFGADGADADAMSERLYDAGAWPVFRIPFDGGRAVAVVYRNLDGDAGIDYLLIGPGSSRPELLVQDDGHRTGAGLGWPELERIADAPDRAADGVHHPAERLLLLLPALDGSESAAGAVDRVARALVEVGAPAGTARATAARLLERRGSGVGCQVAGESPLSGG
ncbi:hypothetical protein [Kitasatospora sp. NPDC056076]|uniref:hypothetical protein n=1 Tax=unclassified Kitasatospora TaxID=2633591 RepID=UPI0035DD7633